jgi:GNAT superfamily N-acetyltransferase
MNCIAQLFEGWEETLIWSCLQGYMGNAWADNSENPQSAQIITGDFCFFAGIPNIELVRNIPDSFSSKYILMVPHTDEWGTMIEAAYRNSFNKFMRHAIKKEPEVFDRKQLGSNVKNLPFEYAVKMIDKEIFHRTRSEEWSKDLCSQFPSYREYEKYGLGAAILRGDELVSGAASYSVYNGGIEIEIDTKPEYRRRGLALACASKLILECLDRNLYPSWDAANKESVALSEKLGYHFERKYVTYSIPVK